MNHNNIHFLINDLDRNLDIVKNDLQIVKNTQISKTIKKEKMDKIKKDIHHIQKEILSLDKEINQLKN